jgi:hypothetical protein
MKIKQYSLSLFALCLSLGGLSADVRAEDTPAFKPPELGAPNSRVGGGTRGLSRGVQEPVWLYALAPDNVGLTLQEQPTLYWAISTQVKEPIEITINHANPESAAAMMPLLETRIEAPAVGIHALSLKEYEVKLAPGVEYEWFISIVYDAKQRSKDITAKGMIMRVAPDSQEAGCVTRKKASLSLTQAYTECGLWYDTLAEVSQQIAANPGDQSLHGARVVMLQQAHLPGAAALDK